MEVKRRNIVLVCRLVLTAQTNTILYGIGIGPSISAIFRFMFCMRVLTLESRFIYIEFTVCPSLAAIGCMVTLIPKLNGGHMI